MWYCNEVLNDNMPPEPPAKCVVTLPGEQAVGHGTTNTFLYLQAAKVYKPLSLRDAAAISQMRMDQIKGKGKGKRGRRR